jgi:hypothetical protein
MKTAAKPCFSEANHIKGDHSVYARTLVFGLAAAAGAALGPAAAQSTYQQNFNTDTTSLAETLAQYPEFALPTIPQRADPPRDAFVTNGVLNVLPENGGRLELNRPNDGDVTIKLDLGGASVNAGPGSWGVALEVGPNRIIFHPGFAGSGLRGAFRVEGAGGSVYPFVQYDMGFTPAENVLHHMEIAINEATGRFDIKITDGANAANVFTFNFTNTNYPTQDPAGTERTIAILAGGGPNSGKGLFDNISITPSVQEVAIDIKPGSTPNCFNINGHGVVPAAILGGAPFNVADVNPASLYLDGLAVRVRGNKGPQCSFQNVNADAFIDLVCQFDDQPGNWVGGQSEGTITGALFDGTAIRGVDTICVTP